MRSPAANLTPDASESNSPTGLGAIRKRKHSVNDAVASGVRRYRASQACQYCRVRKVRCDVLRSDVGCTNCRLDDRECVVLASRRGKTDRWPGSSSNARPNSPPCYSSDPISISNPNIAQRHDDRLSSTAVPVLAESAAATAAAAAGDVPVCVTFDGDNEPIGGEKQPTDDGLTIDYTPSEARDGLESHDPMSSSWWRHPSPNGTTPLPAFIAPFPNKIPAEDLEFLARKGALAVPEPELRAEILRRYTFCVHPFMPMLDLKPFFEAVLNERSDSRISLLLFQAVMFAGLSSLEQHDIHRLGFDNAKQAREVFFTRVKLLYEFDVEPDSAAVFQSLLLMSSWYSKWNEWRDTSHWTALARLVAQNMGLHREPTSVCGSDKAQRHRRRMWWSLFIRDRMLALGTRRPMHIQDDSFDVAMLSIKDFDLEPLTEFSHGQLGVLDSEEQRNTALMCIELAKLCICIGHVLSAQYTTLSTKPAASYTAMVVPRRDGQRLAKLQRCDTEIDEWFKQLPPNICRPSSMLPHVNSSSCSEVHWAMLSLAHLTLINVLHRTQAIQPVSGGEEAQAVRISSRLKVKDASRKVTKISHTMLCRNQVRFLGLNGITALLAACLSHMVDIRTGDDDVRDASIFRFDQSMQVLHWMRSMFASADAAVTFLASVVRKASLPLLPQVTMPAPYFMSASSSHLNGYVGLSDVTSARDNHSSVAYKSSKVLGASWPADQSLPVSQPTSQPSLTGLLDANRQVLDSTVPASGLSQGHSASNMTTDTSTRDHNSLRFNGTFFENVSNSAASEPSMKWNSGVNLEPILYNYDFVWDPLGFSDG